MWFRNRLVNPVVRLLLRSPLHPVLSRSLAAASGDPEAVAAGLRHYLARHPKAAKPFGVRLDANGTPHGTTTAAHPLVVISVHLERSQR